MTFLLKNRNYPDIVPWVFAEPDTAAAVQTNFIYGWADNLLSFATTRVLPTVLAFDITQLQRNSSGKGKRKKN